jgi:cytochrome c oxidase subunit 2
MWDVRHPNGRREFNEIHVPVGRDIELLLSSEDVIHSLFLPAFRVKQDVVPGKTVATWFQATRPGVFHLFCTQFCGTEHAAMVGQVVAQKPEDYAAWLDAGNTDGDVVDRGRALFVKYGCSGCHSTGSTVHAPRLEGVYQTLIPLEGGAMVRADDAYLRDSILQPNKQIAAGFPGIMPSFQGVIPEGELLDLIAYLKTSRTDRPAAGTLPNPSP